MDIGFFVWFILPGLLAIGVGVLLLASGRRVLREVSSPPRLGAVFSTPADRRFLGLALHIFGGLCIIGGVLLYVAMALTLLRH